MEKEDPRRSQAGSMQRALVPLEGGEDVVANWTARDSNIGSAAAHGLIFSRLA